MVATVSKSLFGGKLCLVTTLRLKLEISDDKQQILPMNMSVHATLLTIANTMYKGISF